MYFILKKVIIVSSFLAFLSLNIERLEARNEDIYYVDSLRKEDVSNILKYFANKDLESINKIKDEFLFDTLPDVCAEIDYQKLQDSLKYTEELYRLTKRGTYNVEIILMCVIDKNSKVLKYKLLTPSFNHWAESAILTINNCKCINPAQKNGLPITSVVTLKVKYLSF